MRSLLGLAVVLVAVLAPVAAMIAPPTRAGAPWPGWSGTPRPASRFPASASPSARPARNPTPRAGSPSPAFRPATTPSWPRRSQGARLEALASNGSVIFTAQTRRYLVSPGQDPVEIGSAMMGRGLYVGTDPYVVIAGSLFRVH
jgi:hypothetical protein